MAAESSKLIHPMENIIIVTVTAPVDCIRNASMHPIAINVRIDRNPLAEKLKTVSASPGNSSKVGK